ncbi:MAG: glycosyltransferase family 39 protein [Patescibacteria group bacterium]
MTKIKNFLRKEFMVLVIILLTFLLKFILSYLPSFDIDMGTWLAWAQRLAELGPGKFYSDSVWTQYTPGFLYWLWLVGKLGLTNDLAIKLPVILTEMITGAVIWFSLKRFDEKFARLAFFFYALNPSIVFDSSIWGQVDAVLALFLFLSVYFLTFRNNSILSGLFWGLAFLIKPQALAILPAIGFILFKKFSLKGVGKFLISALATLLILGWPFFPQNPLLGLPELVAKMSSYYAYTSVFAFNFWSVFVGMWRPDSLTFLGSPLFVWGLIFYVSSLILIFLAFGKKKEMGNSYLMLALSLFAFFLFPTRVHERYIFPVFPFLLTAAGMLKSKKVIWAYIAISFLSLVNLYHPYAYYSENFLVSTTILEITQRLAPVVGITFLLLFFGMLLNWRLPEIKIKLLRFSPQTWLWLVMGFAALTRVLFLGSPEKEYFDEVYHAFTAKQILNGNPKAWEWWNAPPEGFAYEWTHPPLAKLGMVLGMLVFGENSFGWRIPGALLGVGSAFLIYLIAKRIFNDEVLPILAAAIFSLDGLTLVMARIGMNDSYLLFFVLLSIYLFLTNKHFFSALAFGLAISSKWSAVWALPILFVSHLVLGKKIKISYLWFALLPPLIYLATYIPLFLTNHGLDIFWEMQKQMWWYHTNLKATHPYTSPWWSWPTLSRPIYLYTSDEVGGMVARIYAMGNPLVFWAGLVSVFASFYYAFKERNKMLALSIFSYLVFFVPWAASPRIMFLYHYLPSIPFLAILTGYVLRRNRQLTLPFFVFTFILFLYFFPHFTGIKIPLGVDKSYYWFPSWR